ncbi:MAG TPA: hypothetical protein VJ226_09330 [Bradyrhizobium sp.]|nr:hypothetical protein [Bradyrhizobium sp.]
MAVYADRARMLTPTTGAGTVTLGASPSGFQTFTAAGVATASQIEYLIEDGVNWEIGNGVYNTTGPTMTRALRSSSTGSLLSLSGAAIVSLVPTAMTVNALSASTGRNQLLNALFNVQQRGVGPFTTTAAYTADRWVLGLTGDTNSVTLAALTDTDRAQIGDETATACLQDVVTGAATAANFSILTQRTEDVRRLSGKTVTFSIWAKASAALNLGLVVGQSFGTGGTPSAAVPSAAIVFALTTTWQRFTATFVLGSAAAKTMGTANDHGSYVQLAFSSGTTNAAAYGVGAQSGTFQLWGAQLEVGPLACALEKRLIGQEISLCQRYYQAGNFEFDGGSISTKPFGGSIELPVLMRSPPTVTVTTTVLTGVAAPTAGTATATAAALTVTGVASATSATMAGTYKLTADI